MRWPRCCAISAGSKTGDRVTIHMPMVPELPVTMLACARLGLIHSVVFGGFSGEACGMRIADSGSKVLITIDGYYRSGDLTDHKDKADTRRRGCRKRRAQDREGPGLAASRRQVPLRHARWSRTAISSWTTC